MAVADLSHRFEGESVGRALELVGERWTLLILRSALYGVRRFDDFQAELDIPRSVLSNRLTGEVRAGEVTVRGCTLPLVERDTPDGQVVALVRPEAVTLASHDVPESGLLVGTVIAVTFLGATSRVTVDLGDATILAQLTTADATALSAGSRVALTIRPDPVLVSASSDPAVSVAGEEA